MATYYLYLVGGSSEEIKATFHTFNLEDGMVSFLNENREYVKQVPWNDINGIAFADPVTEEPKLIQNPKNMKRKVHPYLQEKLDKMEQAFEEAKRL